MEFTLQEYKRLLKEIIENNFEICTYSNYKQVEKPCILRHDIDYDINMALNLAKIEHELGAKSTYFILLTSDFYNVCSVQTIRIIKQLHNYGHEIGLHFDELSYDVDVDVVQAIKNECEIMSNIIGIPVTSVSMHRPSQKTLNANYKIDGIINSYDQVFFKEFKYISDSRCNWREKPFEVIKEYDKIHVLTHPFWYTDKNLSINESVSTFVKRGNVDRYEILKDNIRDIEEIMKKEEVK